MKIVLFASFVLVFFMCRCDKKSINDASSKSPFSIKVEGPLLGDSMVLKSIGLNPTKYDRYSIEIEHVLNEVYIFVLTDYPIYMPSSSAHIKNSGTDSLKITSGAGDYFFEIKELQVKKGENYKFFFFEPILSEPYDSIYFSFTYFIKKPPLGGQTIEARLKYKTLDQ